MILVIDNYDSFTFNLVQYLGEMGHELKVFRNDAITPEALINKVGTYGMTLASVQAGIPAYIISSTLKITSELKPDWIIKENTKVKLTERTQLFEPVPLELFAEAFTELGSSKPTRLFRMR